MMASCPARRTEFHTAAQTIHHWMLPPLLHTHTVVRLPVIRWVLSASAAWPDVHVREHQVWHACLSVFCFALFCPQMQDKACLKQVTTSCLCFAITSKLRLPKSGPTGRGLHPLLSHSCSEACCPHSQTCWLWIFPNDFMLSLLCQIQVFLFYVDKKKSVYYLDVMTFLVLK